MGPVSKVAASLYEPERIALRQRKSAARDTFVVRGMFFSSSLEIVRRLVGEDGVKEVAQAAGLTATEWSIMKKYSLPEFLELEWHAAARLEPIVGSFEDGVARVGAGAVEIFYESVAGRTMKLLGGRDPHRLMGAAPNAYPLTYTDDGKREYARVSDNHGSFSFENDMLGPCHQIGVFTTAIKLACDTDVEVELTQPDLFRFTLDIRW